MLGITDAARQTGTTIKSFFGGNSQAKKTNPQVQRQGKKAVSLFDQKKSSLTNLDRTSKSSREQMMQEKGRIIDQMISGDISDRHRKMVKNGLKDWGNNDLEKLKNAGVKIEVRNKQDFIKHFEDKYGTPPVVEKTVGGKTERSLAAGAYDNEDKKVMLRSDRLFPNMISHEMAHADDDIREKDSFFGEKMKSCEDPKFKKLYEAYLERTKGGNKSGAMWSDYARQDVKEYWAEGMSQYKNSYNRARLEKLDPQLAEYFKNLPPQ